MKRIMVLLLLTAFTTMGASAQTTNKIEKAMKDPATKERSEKADALLMDRNKIFEKDGSSPSAVKPTQKKKSGKCNKRNIN